MLRRFVSGILRIALVATLMCTTFFALKNEFLSALNFSNIRQILPYIMLFQVFGCYSIYMIANAIREFRGKFITYKILYILTAIVTVMLNALMIIDFVESKTKLEVIHRDWLADSLALTVLMFAIFDFFAIFIKKSRQPKNKKQKQFSTDDYQDFIIN